MGSIGKNIPHDSAAGHVTGESIFIDDQVPARNEVFVDFVGSPVAHGEITTIDIEAARQVPGVVAIFTHADIPGHKRFGPVMKDEHLLAEEKVFFVHDPIVLIAAESRQALLQAKKLVKVQVRELPPIFSIDDAIAQNSFIGPERVIKRGDVARGFADADQTIEGELTIGGQEHFYLESQIAIAYPGENGSVTVHSSTQHPTECQNLIAEVLGVDFNHVTVICKRMGGAFGGKETQAAQPAIMAALVATKLKRPARLFISKDDDMRWTGKRHPFKGVYKVGFTREGRLTAYDLKLFSNGGWSCDLSTSVLERAMMHSDNAYFIPHFRVTGRICKTNLPSNTAFRGFGGPQGVVNIENVIEEIAQTLNIDAAEIRRRNVYGSTRLSPSPGTPREGRGEGSRITTPQNDRSPLPSNPHPASPGVPGEEQEESNTAPYGQIIKNNTLPRIFDDLATSSHYKKRRGDIDAFNRKSKTQLRGMSMTAVKFGISFTKKTLNQANALVNIYTDGTVLVTTGGTEMGQGVYTRVRQIVADELGIPYDSVLIGATATDKNNNTSPTAASSGTDLNGAAARDACLRLRERLAAYASQHLGSKDAGLTPSPSSIIFDNGEVFDEREPHHRISFRDLICRAYIDRVNLGERGFYTTPGIDFNRETGRGHPFLYFTNGAAVSEVLIDRFTGEMRVTRVDLLMDAGESINPGIDRGQITGGFVQGMGWVTTEELKWSPQGELWSHSPTTYKIPNISDLPEVFNVATIENSDNLVSLYRSKALGEPPLLLGISIWCAVKNALSYASNGQIARLALPATCEEILLTLAKQARGIKSTAAEQIHRPA